MSVQPEYFGGTPTSPTGYRKPSKSILQSIIDDAKSNPIFGTISSAVDYGSDINLVGGLISAFTESTSFQPGIKGLDASMRATASGADAETATQIGQQAEELGKQQQLEANNGIGIGPVGVFLGAVEKAWSHGVTRPLSTVALVTDPDSPLYQGDVFTNELGEEIELKPGFQWDDIRNAWNRSEQVSFGQAAAANNLAHAMTGLDFIYDIGGIGNYDPWSLYDMAKAQENPYYRFITGATDFGLEVVVPPIARVGRLAAMQKMGLRNSVLSADDIAKRRTDYELHREWRETGGQQGTRTTFGDYVDEIAEETNAVRLRENPAVANSHGVDKFTLSTILSKTSDRDTVANIMLANVGDVQALRDLAAAAPDTVWALSDMNAILRSADVNGEVFSPKGEALIKTNQIFDSALARDEYFTELKNLFTTTIDDALFVRGPGSAWLPSRGAKPLKFIGIDTRFSVEKIRIGKGKFAYATRSADYADAPRWVQKVAQTTPGGPITTFIQWVGSRQPLGHITMSGARPDDIWSELGAQFDSVPMLRGNKQIVVGTEIVNGIPQDITIPAYTYRVQIMEQLQEAKRAGNLKQVYQQVEDVLVANLARTLNVDRQVAATFVRGYRERMQRAIDDLNENGGYLYDEAGSRIITDPVSRRQLLESFPTLPLEEIYRGLRDEVRPRIGAVDNTATLLTSVFDAGMKFFRTNVLFRPGYTGKNAALEPMLASWLAHGTILTDEGLGATLGNFIANRRNTGARAVYLLNLDKVIKNTVRAVTGKGEKVKSVKKLRSELRALVQQRHDTQAVIDGLLIELDNLKAGKLSAIRAEQIEPEIKGRLVDAQLRLNAIEDALDGKAPEWRQVVEPARLSTVREKLIEYREAVATGQLDDETVKRIDDLQKEYDDLVSRKDTDYTDPAREIEIQQQAMEYIDQKIAAAQLALGRRREAIAEVSGMRGYRGSGQGYTDIIVGGETIRIPSAFSDRQFDYGPGYRAEASVATTNRLTYDPSYRAEYEISRWQRTGQQSVVEPTDPAYWDEIANVANRYFRGDALIQLILEGKTRAELAEWLESKAGRKYQKGLKKKYLVTKEQYDDIAPSSTTRMPGSRVDETSPGVSDTVGPGDPARRLPSERQPVESPTSSVLNSEKARPPQKRKVLLSSTTELDEVIRIVYQYFPDEKVRQQIARQEVTPGELQAALGGRRDLSRISGDDLLFIPKSRIALAYEKLNRGLDRVWQFIATTPEDRIARWPFYQREFKKQMQQRADVLDAQGVKLSESQFEAMRQAAHRASLIELEKTFYNIRRYNNPVYMSRFLLSFPGAFYNSIYRYGRFLVKEPERVIQTALFANDILLNLAVDADGNPVDDPSKAEYIIIPGTKKNATDTGVRIPVASLATVTVNAPALSYAASALVSEITKRNPKTEEILQETLGPAYEEIFPYGINKNIASGFFGSYQKDIYRAAKGLSDADFIRASVQVYADDVAQWEKNGGVGEEPNYDDAVEKTRNFYLSRGGKKFFNAFSISQRVPGQLMRDAWYNVRKQYPGNPEEARNVYLQQYGDWARWYTYSGTDYKAFVPPTQDAYQRIWVDYPDIARDMAKDENSMEFINLLALGTEGDYSAAVANYLRNNPLPGETEPVATIKSAGTFEAMVKKNDGWSWYNKQKIKFDAEMKRLRTLRDEAGTTEAKDRFRNQIDQAERSWKSWVDNYKEVNPAWGTSFDGDRGGNVANQAARQLRNILKHPKFSKNEGKEELWQDIAYFLDNRDTALKALEGLSSKEKKVVKANFAEWVQTDVLENSPEFNEAWQRYFAKEWGVENES